MILTLVVPDETYAAFGADHREELGGRMETVVLKKFSDAKIQAAIDHALAVLPPDRTVAVVAHADLNGASLTAVGKIGDHWSVSGHVSKPWKGALSAEAEVIASW